MEAMRESWTDDRLDHLSARMDERFDALETRMDERLDAVETRMDERLDAAETRMDERFESVGRRFAEVDRRFAEVDRRLGRVEEGQRDQRTEIVAMRTSIEARFDTTQYMITRVGAGLFATVFMVFLSLLLAQS